MIAAIAAVVLGASPPTDFGARIAESAAAAEALQGPLDGVWAVVDARGGDLADLQISDPPSGVGLAGAWSAPGGTAVGPITAIRRSRSRLRLVWTAGGADWRLALRQGSDGGWRGWLDAGRVRTAVRLVRRSP